MKAMVYTQYGSPEVLRLAEVKQPAPADDEVLVKVHAAALNSWDWDWLNGKPYIYRLLSGVTKPKLPILGADVAGTVSEVGSKVTKFKPGDEVFGDLSAGKWGGFAEYACAKEEELTIKPASMTFEEAASIPQAACMALQGLTDKRAIQPGDEVLINGAGGGVGTFAVQMAHNLGAIITAVDLAEKHDMLLSVGAQHVLDYTAEDFTKAGQQYDLIIDVMATKSPSDYKKALKPGGAYVMIGGTIGSILRLAFVGRLISSKEKKLTLLAHKPNHYLDTIIELFKAGKVKPVIDSVLPLSETPQAFQKIGGGRSQGKIVISNQNK